MQGGLTVLGGGLAEGTMTATNSAIRKASPEARSIFEREWVTYRKMVDNNYLFHREAYDRLRQILLAGAPAPFRFLDVACGDAGESARVLAHAHVSSYDGIDLCAPALELARANLAALDCPVRLHLAELEEALFGWEAPIDVAWVGLSLHHFPAAGKLRILRSIRSILSPRGLLLFYENAGPDDEDRQNWLQRWDRQRRAWREYSDDEWSAMHEHVHTCDFPETGQRWLELGRQAGFTDTREIYRAPTDLFRMYLMRT
jgi:SAM-dependent methyltransferase